MDHMMKYKDIQTNRTSGSEAYSENGATNRISVGVIAPSFRRVDRDCVACGNSSLTYGTARPPLRPLAHLSHMLCIRHDASVLSMRSLPLDWLGAAAIAGPLPIMEI